MRLTRRAVLAALGAAGLGAPAAGAQSLEPGRIPITIAARRLDAFEPRSPGKARFGKLSFRGGLELRGSHPRFGGFSGLWRSRNGVDLVALTDHGFWLTARTVSERGCIAGFEQAELAPILGASGRPLHRSRYYDTESLTIVDGIAYVGVERVHEILRFDWSRHGVEARARPVPVSVPMQRELKRLSSNRGLEAIGIVPAGQPLAGALVAVAERSGKEDEPTLGLIIGGPQPGLFHLRSHDGFDITDLAFLPGGDLLLLERWYKTLRGVGMRIRRVAGASLKPGALLDGPSLIEADLGHEIDNMEGLCIHQDQGRTILTLISDDNFSFLQRTLLLEFELA